MLFTSFASAAAPVKALAIIDNTFFAGGEICKGQEQEMANCTGNKTNKGTWSCSLHHCLSLEEMQIVNWYRKECHNMPSVESQCIKTALEDFRGALNFQKAPDQKCIGAPEKIKLCNQKGLHWNCKIGICTPTRISLVLSKNLYDRCSGKGECISELNRIIKKYICTKEFKNEECIPSDIVLAKMNNCTPKTANDLVYFSPMHDLCFSTYDLLTYLEKLKNCVMTKSYLASSPLGSKNNPVFNSIDACIDDLNKKSESRLKETKKKNL